MNKLVAADLTQPADRMPSLRVAPPPAVPIVTPPPSPGIYPPIVTTPDNTVLVIVLSVVVVAGFVLSFLAGYFLSRLWRKSPQEQTLPLFRMPITDSTPVKS